MANNSAVEAATTSSVFPLPPMRYINAFTDDNVANNVCPSPPRPITDGQYSMFGQTIAIDDHIIRSLESQGLRRLYPREYDHRRELKKMNASILVNFLDLLDVMVRCPETPKREEKCTDIQLLFITMHHLINELRPHQARESIRVLMQSHKRQRFETTARLNKQIERVNDMINLAVAAIQDQTSKVTGLGLNGDGIGLHSQLSADQRDQLKSDDMTSDNSYHLDALMCDLVDEISS